ncbi:hypothetical protein [Marinomonas balearica]|uniref:Uncharacterized protein n=1 Tax=Marinomonas balearica TaxID=491947 RepID=A0A4R6MFX6_9GAMM|nr:hypothetical protein [Marinomonas balearica]TDO99660.1 hypothetical protein DFP79_0647 [Marinomonas balearica]
MLKKNMIKAYQSNATLPKSTSSLTQDKKTYTQKHNTKDTENDKGLYRSDEDERLIKDYHFAKFQKNLDQIQNNQALQSLIDQEEWSEEDIKTLLANFR